MESLTPRRVVPPHSLKLERSLSKKWTTTQRIYHNSVIRAATRIYNPLQNEDVLPLLTTTRGGKQQTKDNNSRSDPFKELNSNRQSKVMKKLTIIKGGITSNQELLQMQKEREEFHLSNDPDISREIKNPITGGG